MTQPVNAPNIGGMSSRRTIDTTDLPSGAVLDVYADGTVWLCLRDLRGTRITLAQWIADRDAQRRRITWIGPTGPVDLSEFDRAFLDDLAAICSTIDRPDPGAPIWTRYSVHDIDGRLVGLIERRNEGTCTTTVVMAP